MLHPSYLDLMNVANENVAEGETPVVTSRYSIVMAASKRARQIVSGDAPLADSDCPKPLSVAVAELAQKQTQICGGETED